MTGNIKVSQVKNNDLIKTEQRISLQREFILCFASLKMHFLSDFDICINNELTDFVCNTCDDDSKIQVGTQAAPQNGTQDRMHNEVLRIEVRTCNDEYNLNEYTCIGEDPICRYYKNKKNECCVLRGGIKGALGYTFFESETKGIFKCFLNSKALNITNIDINIILRMIPLKRIFVKRAVSFIHASAVIHQGKSIVFCAPSGVGKTTQANLWAKYRNSEIMCNDRVLLKKNANEGRIITYGFPVDGSTPVGSNKKVPLLCIVLLKQGTVNEACLLKTSKALVGLMNQSIIDVWDNREKIEQADNLMSLLKKVPVYELSCTADIRAVECLEEIIGISKEEK